MRRIIWEENKEIFELLTSFGLYEKFANEQEKAIFVTPEQFAIGYILQQIDKINKKLGLDKT